MVVCNGSQEAHCGVRWLAGSPWWHAMARGCWRILTTCQENGFLKGELKQSSRHHWVCLVPSRAAVGLETSENHIQGRGDVASVAPGAWLLQHGVCLFPPTGLPREGPWSRVMAGGSTQDRGPWGGVEVGCGPSAWTWEGPGKESQLLGLASLGQLVHAHSGFAVVTQCLPREGFYSVAHCALQVCPCAMLMSLSLTCPPTLHGCAEPKDVPEEALTQPMQRACITHLEPWARRACFQKQSLTLREEVCVCIVYVRVHVCVRDLYVDVCNVGLHICV